MVTYPERRVYIWERGHPVPLNIADRQVDSRAISWEKIVRRCLSVAQKGTPQHKTWADVLEALDDIQCEYNIHTLTPKKFKQLLVASAQRNGWWARTSTRKGFTAVVEGRPDLRRCYKCKKEKPVAEFSARMTEGKRRVYGKGKDHYTHTLCDVCRSNKERPAAKMRKRAKKGITANAEDISLVQALRFRMSLLKSRSEHVVASDPDGLSSATYFHRLRVECIARARSALEGIIFHGQPIPDQWQMLLTDVARRSLHEEFHDKVMPAWTGRGRAPSCF